MKKTLNILCFFFVLIFKKNYFVLAFYKLVGIATTTCPLQLFLSFSLSPSSFFGKSRSCFFDFKFNLFLKNDNTKLKIYNASTDGKSTRGYVNDFLYWFPKIPNFKPKVFIFYIGVNDSNPYPEGAKHYDLKLADNTILKIRDYIKNNSITLELIKKTQDKYFPKVISAYVRTEKNLYENRFRKN